MPIQRTKRPKQSRRNPYPARGSAAGDAPVGPCDGDGCDRKLYKGDIFFTNALGFLMCVDCWEKVPGIQASMHRASGDDLSEQYRAKLEAEGPGRSHWEGTFETVWDGEFPK